MVRQNEQPEKLLLRVSEVAEKLSVARSKAYMMIASGEIVSVKLGKSVRVPAAALQQYVDKLTEAAQAGYSD
jgi:excisionase family DNA binding protein